MAEETTAGPTNNSFTLTMWGERGLVTTLFVDVNAAGAAGWDALLAACEFPTPVAQGQRVTGAQLVIEPDFGAFGKPDAVVRLTLADGANRVLILEAKRGL